MTWPLQSGNPTHALAAPRLAVSAPKRTVIKPRTSATTPTNPGRQPGAIGASVFPGLAPGVRFAVHAATSNVASKSIAVPRCRITVHGGRLNFTVTAPSNTCRTSRPSATYAAPPGRWRAVEGGGGRCRSHQAYAASAVTRTLTPAATGRCPYSMTAGRSSGGGRAPCRSGPGPPPPPARPGGPADGARGVGEEGEKA